MTKQKALRLVEREDALVLEVLCGGAWVQVASFDHRDIERAKSIAVEEALAGATEDLKPSGE